jgi:hypothetical protein
MVGKRFGRLTVIKINGRSRYGQNKWLCKCDCGNEKTIEGASLRRGVTVSCGCYQREIAKLANTTHGYSHKPEHNIWAAMITRCYNKNYIGAKNYSGRGITVCDSWLNSFENFLKDMGNRPTRYHSIERVNNDGNYEPVNCKWEVREVQDRNKRSNRFIEMDGVKMCIQDWLNKYNKTQGCIKTRIKMGMSLEDALKTPVGIKRIKKNNL